MSLPFDQFLPPGWRLAVELMDGAKYYGPKGISVIWSVAVEADGLPWLHVSVAHPKRLPTWDELKLVKYLFIGDERKAIQVFPKAKDYVNIHPYCLHLWHCLRDDPLPEFSGEVLGRKTI